MPLRFLDNASQPMPPLYRFYTSESTEENIVTLRLPCRAGYYLWAIVPVGVTAEISQAGEDDWHDLAAGEFDLSPFAPGDQAFDLNVVGNGVGTDDIRLAISETDPF